MAKIDASVDIDLVVEFAKLKALTDDSVKGLLKSIGDIAALENLITRIGQTSDAIVAAGATGSVSAKLRRVTQGLEDLKSLIVLATGTNTIGKVNIKRVPVITSTTGTETAIATLTPAADFHLLEVRFHLGSALAAGETLTITLDANDGVAYDVVLFSSDLGTAGILDVVVEFGDDNYFFESGDKIVIALSANTGGDTWGCQTVHELV